MHAWLTLLIVSSAGCLIDVDYSGTQFRCEPGGDCPPDHDCVGGVCVQSSGAPDAMPTSDAAPLPDAAAADAAPLVCPTGCSEIDTTGVCFCPTEVDW